MRHWVPCNRRPLFERRHSARDQEKLQMESNIRIFSKIIWRNLTRCHADTDFAEPEEARATRTERDLNTS